MNISEKIERAHAIGAVAAELFAGVEEAERRYAELEQDAESWVVESRREAFIEAQIKREIIEWLLK